MNYTNISAIEDDILLGGISPYNNVQSMYREENIERILRENGIQLVISVYDIHPPKRHIKGIKQYLIVIEDSPESKLYPYFDRVADIIHNARKNKLKIFIHCHAGISRSVSLLTAYYLKYQPKGDTNNKTTKILQFIREKRPFIRPNNGFLKQLLLYEKYLKSGRPKNIERKNDKLIL